MSRFDNFYFANRLRWLNRGLQIIFSLTLGLGILYLSSLYFNRWDLTAKHRYSLSAETVAYLKNISQELNIYVTFSAYDKSEDIQLLQKDLKGLLREYSFTLDKLKQPLLKIHYLDPYLQRQQIEALQKHLDMPCENSIIFTYGQRHEVLMAGDLYKIEEGKIVGFIGEQALTSALVRLLTHKTPKIYTTIGHGEADFDDVNPLYGASQAKLFASARGLSFEKIDLLVSPIPEDTDCIFILGPKKSFLPEEVLKLRDYLYNRKGRIIILMAPFYQNGLENLLEDYGILADGAILVDKALNAHLSGGDLIIRRFAQHALTQPLIDYRLTLVTGITSAVRPLSVFENSRFLSITPLFISSDNSWAKPHQVKGDFDLFEPLKGDFHGPIALACISEPKKSNALGVDIDMGRMIAIGGSDWINNHHFNLLGNAHFFWQLCQWSIQRPLLQSLTPRMLEYYQLPLSQIDLMWLCAYFMGPGFILLGLGMIVYGFKKYLYRRKHTDFFDHSA